MLSTLRWAGLILLIATFMLGCRKSGDEKPIGVPTEGMLKMASKNAEFGWKLFQIASTPNNQQNVLISPLSIHLALSMAVNGATSLTREEMLQALECSDYALTAEMNKDWKDLIELLTRQSGHPSVTLKNAFFYDPNRIRIENTFRQKLADFYTAHIAQDNFNDADAAKNRINTWVKESTSGKIDKVVEGIKPEDLAFLVNALHFKADWSVAFDVHASVEADFKQSASERKNITFMTGDRDFKTYQDARLQAVDLPFRDSTYSLTLLMGRDATDFDMKWISDVQWEDIRALWKKMVYGRALVQIPRMRLQYEQQMIPLLQNLGIKDAFTPGLASFHDMGRPLIGQDIYISSVFHKSVLEVDEKGAEGAAVTSITFSTTSLPPVFTFDRPYVLLLRHIPTNAILFSGKIVNPK